MAPQCGCVQEQLSIGVAFGLGPAGFRSARLYLIRFCLTKSRNWLEFS